MTATTTERLRRLTSAPQTSRIPLGSVVAAMGTSATGLCLLLFGLVTLIPGIAPLFGVALCAVSFGMVLGRGEPFLPAWMRRWEIERERLDAGLRRLAPFVAWLERWLRPRAAGLLRGPTTRLAGVAALVNGILVVLPIPFGNTAPAVATVVLALGLVVGDGLAVGAGLFLTAAALAVDAGLIALGYTALTGLLESLF